MKVLITGATGSLGRTVLSKLLEKQFIESITCFSRDEQKQQLLPKSDKIKPIIGDIRDPFAVHKAMQNVHLVMHFAALKCVDIMERNIHESIQTNIKGTENIFNEAHDRGTRLVFTSTDKSVAPVNVYGHCKAISERIVLQNPSNAVCRYGNVIGSRGSAIPYFIQSLKETGSVNITDPEMTRFWIHIEEAADFVISSAFLERKGICIPKMRAAKVTRVTDALAKLLGLTNYKMNIVGVRAGEKLHEQLDDNLYSNNEDIQFTDEELVDKLRPIVKELT